MNFRRNLIVEQNEPFAARITSRLGKSFEHCSRGSWLIPLSPSHLQHGYESMNDCALGPRSGGSGQTTSDRREYRGSLAGTVLSWFLMVAIPFFGHEVSVGGYHDRNFRSSGIAWGSPETSQFLECPPNIQGIVLETSVVSTCKSLNRVKIGTRAS